jgi:integrase/recombinase XerD
VYVRPGFNRDPLSPILVAVHKHPKGGTAKTGTTVRVPLPPVALAALEAIDSANEYFFWSGLETRKAAVGDYQRAFKKLYGLAKVEKGYAHRWRDTFAVELLLNGVPLEPVSILLGHQSMKITEKHY